MDSCTMILVELIRASPWIISAFAWPAEVFGTACLFRIEIGKLLKRPHIQASYGDLKIRLLEKAEKTKKKLLERPANTVAPPTLEEQEGISELNKQSPRTGILAMRIKLEEAIVSYADAKGLVVPGPHRNVANLIRLLRKRGFIDRTISALLDDLRSIGNSVALDVSEPTENEAFRYKELAVDVIKQLDFLTSEAQGPLEKAVQSPE